MAALTAIALAVSAATAVGSYAQQRKAAKQQRLDANKAAEAARLEAQSNQMAADAANARERSAATVRQNEALAAEEAAQSADVTAAEESPVNRKRRVQAQFNVGDAGASSSTGSIRV